MDEVMFETIDEVIAYVKEKGIKINEPLLGCGCPHHCHENVIRFPSIPYINKCPKCDIWYRIVGRGGIIHVIELESMDVTPVSSR